MVLVKYGLRASFGRIKETGTQVGGLRLRGEGVFYFFGKNRFRI